MTDEEYDRSIAECEWWSRYEDESEPYEFQTAPADVLDWLSDMDMAEEVGELLDMMAEALHQNDKVRLSVVLSDYLDRHEEEIKRFIND